MTGTEPKFETAVEPKPNLNRKNQTVPLSGHYLVFADNFFLCQKKRFLIAKLLRLCYARRLSVSYHKDVRTSQKMLGVRR